MNMRRLIEVILAITCCICSSTAAVLEDAWQSLLHPLQLKNANNQNTEVTVNNGTNPCNQSVPVEYASLYPWARPLDRDHYCGVHTIFVTELQTMRQAGEHYGMVWFGDSLVSSLRWPWGPLMGSEEVFHNYTERYTAQALGMGLDTTASLMWRLLAGGTPVGLGVKVIVMHVGVNDLWAGTAEVSVRLKVAAVNQAQIVYYLLQQDPQWQVLVLGPLPYPQGTDGPLESRNQWPNAITEPLQHYNAYLKTLLKRVGAAEGNHRVHFLSCWKYALTPDGAAIDPSFTPDGWHPSPAGWTLLFQECISPKLRQMMGY